MDGAISNDQIAILQWILKEPQQVNVLSRTSVWDSTVTSATEFIIEIGPRLVIDNCYIHNTSLINKSQKKSDQKYKSDRQVNLLKAKYSIM